MIIKKEIIEKLSKELSLPYKGTEQDWEIEMANSKMINRFLDFYEENKLNNDEKIGLISLILASYDDFLNENNIVIDDRWFKVKEILESEIQIYSELVDYWALDNESGEENIFKITPLIREIKCEWEREKN